MTSFKKFSLKNGIPAVSLATGMLLAMGVTVFATSIGTDVSVTGDLTITSGARVGADATPGNITALANDSLFVEGQSEFDGIAWFDGSLRASSTLLVTGAATFYGNTTLTDATTTNFAVSNSASTSLLTVSASSTLTRLGLSGAFFSTSNATSALAAGVNVTSGCFAVNGTCVGGAGALIGGSNTQIQYNNSSSFGGASNFVYQNSRVGIGTTTPGALLSLSAGDFILSGANIIYASSSTSTLIAGSAIALAYATSSADIPFLRFDTANTRLGISTSTPTATLTVGGAGNIYAVGGLGIGVATTTAGAIETTGNALFGDAAGDAAAFNAATIRFNNAGTTSIPSANAAGWAIATSSADVPFVRYDTSNYRIGVGTTSPSWTFSVAGDALVSGNLRVGANSSVSGIIHGFCDFGAIDAQTTIAATTTGAVACTTQAPAGLSAGDKVWLTASTSAIGILPGTFIYTGMASSTAANRIQALIYNTSGGTLTIPTTTWQYLIIK